MRRAGYAAVGAVRRWRVVAPRHGAARHVPGRARGWRLLQAGCSYLAQLCNPLASHPRFDPRNQRTPGYRALHPHEQWGALLFTTDGRKPIWAAYLLKIAGECPLRLRMERQSARFPSFPTANHQVQNWRRSERIARWVAG